MKKQGARALLVVSCLLAAAVVVQDFRFDRSHQHDRARLLDIERQTGTLLSWLGEMRVAQTAYLAAGQGPDFWMQRVNDLSVQIEDGITHLRDAVTTNHAQIGINTASAILSELLQVDARARSAVQAGQRFVAADIIFADSVNGTQRLAETLADVRTAERTAIETILQRESYVRLAMTPIALMLVLLSAYLAGRRQRLPARSAAEEMAQMIRELPPPVKAPVPATTQPAIPAAAPVAPPKQPIAAPPPAPAISWSETAELCADLARVVDARDMPALVQRAARTLDAAGLVIWVIDTEGQTLTPVLAHGYPDRVMAKLSALPATADNVTSLSYRSMRPQSMPATGKDGSSSAIAVPLITTEGCYGVLAAEVPGPRPSAERLAVARILAAQLATMLSPIELPAKKAVEAS